MKYGWVHKNIVDIWSHPKYNSERVNQALFCDTLRISSERSSFLRIIKEDGYTGWMDKRFVTICSKNEINQFLKKRKYTVFSQTARIYNAPNDELPKMILYGTKLYKERVQNNQILCKTPSMERFCLTKSSAKPILSTKNNLNRKFVTEAKRFLDIPYLWGGISPFGFDCSGLVQTIAGQFGVEFPRDTKDQIKAGRMIEIQDIQTGDLLFFKRHVGFAIGKNRVIHSSVGGNGVRINSLDPKDKDFRKDLKETFQQARRII
ncbi:MAG: NlpC/P60 family protein [Calditrichaeota bacterium]|nr:MAG: NlpC/P60 family protein [Calditrichota bacterium]